MKYIFITICSIVLSTYSLEQTKPKLCINCKHFRTNEFGNELGKCSLFPKTEENNVDFLVNGIIKDIPIDYNFASVVRKFKSCGKEGRLYERKNFDYKSSLV